MFMEITDIDLFDQNVGMVCAQHLTQMFIDITSIDLFDQIRDMACVEIRLRCSWKLQVLIYFI